MQEKISVSSWFLRWMECDNRSPRIFCNRSGEKNWKHSTSISWWRVSRKSDQFWQEIFSEWIYLCKLSSQSISWSLKQLNPQLSTVECILSLFYLHSSVCHYLSFSTRKRDHFPVYSIFGHSKSARDDPWPQIWENMFVQWIHSHLAPFVCIVDIVVPPRSRLIRESR